VKKIVLLGLKFLLISFANVNNQLTMPKKIKQKLQDTNVRTDTCFNPFNLLKHPKRRTLKLRKVNKHLLRVVNFPVTVMSLKQKICDTCRLRIQKVKKENESINNQAEKVCILIILS